MAKAPATLTIGIDYQMPPRKFQVGDVVSIQMENIQSGDAAYTPRAITALSEDECFAGLWFPEYRVMRWFHKSLLKLVDSVEAQNMRDAEKEAAIAEHKRHLDEDAEAERRADAVLAEMEAAVYDTKRPALEPNTEWNKPNADEYEFVQAPVHYNDHPSGIECQVIIRECKDPMVAFAMKHLWRSQWGAKPGQSSDQDIRKAIEYLQLEEARRAGVSRL